MIKEQFFKNQFGWKRSSLEGFSQDGNGDYLPWMTYPAIEFLQRNLQKNHKVFEFGCGASTLFFAKKVANVFSIETNSRWLEILKEKTSDSFNNIKITLMEDGFINNSYQNFLKNYQQEFDFVVIDSLKRYECAKNSIDALKKGGAIILDDSERKNYQKIFDFFAEKNFIKQDFLGIAPAQIRLKNTTFFWKNY
jgi:precorrin-6B methylase 2